MGIEIPTRLWEPPAILHFLLFFACLCCLFFRPQSDKFSQRTCFLGSNVAAVYRFQRRFLLVYSIGSFIGGLQSIFGEFEYSYYGVSRRGMVLALSLGYGASVFISTLSGIFSDAVGHKLACIVYFFLHFFAGLLKNVGGHVAICVANIFVALASSIFFFSFESWIVVEHEKLNDIQDLLINTFWLMSFADAASLIGSQALGNLFLSWNAEKGITFPSSMASALALFCVIFITQNWGKIPAAVTDSGSDKITFPDHIIRDKRIHLLVWAQAFFHFSMEIFWFLWAPTIEADGREVHLSAIYPCLLGARMLGTTAVPWLLDEPFCMRVEDLLSAAFCIASMVIFIVAYDYQEIGFLVALFCIYQGCVGLISPSLAKLRNLLVPDDSRASMMSISLVPANASVLFVLIQGGYYESLSNALILAFSSFGLLMAAVFVHTLKRWVKRHHEDLHKL